MISAMNDDRAPARAARMNASLAGLSVGDAFGGNGSFGNGAAMRVAPLGA